MMRHESNELIIWMLPITDLKLPRREPSIIAWWAKSCIRSMKRTMHRILREDGLRKIWNGFFAHHGT